MPHRRLVYDGEIPRTLDFLEPQTTAMVALGRLAVDLLFGQADPAAISVSTLIAGFKPSYPGGLVVNLEAGRMYGLQQVDPTSVGDLPIDTRIAFKQFDAEATTYTFGAPPATVGFSRIDLIEAQFVQEDTDPEQLLYWNSAASDQPWLGPNNTGTTDFLNRKCSVHLQIKVGTASASPTAPTADAGWTALFYVTVPHGLVNITSAQFAVDGSAKFLTGLLTHHHTGVNGAGPKIDLATETTGSLPATLVSDSGGTDAQTYFNRLRHDKGEVADVTARNSLTVVAGDYVVVADSDGSGTPAWEFWNGTAWVIFSGTGGGGGTSGNVIVHPQHTFTGGETTATVPVPYDTALRQLLVFNDHMLLVQGVDWTPLTTTSITLTQPAIAGEVLQIVQFFITPGTSVYQIVGEQPSGVVNSTDGTNGNGVFTLVQTPLLSPVPRVYFDGTHISTSWYGIAGNTITFVSGFKPQTNGVTPEVVTVDYSWQ